MRRVLLLTCLLVLIASTAEARHRHRHWSGYAYFRSAPLAYGFVSPDKNLQRRSFAQGSIKPVDMVPPNWQLQPVEPNWKGKRFLSPDGTSWLAVYAFPATPEQLSTHMKSTAFVDGETVTYLRGERDWIVASGTKGDRIFYRKAVIACGGKVWHHIAFEYPTERKRAMDPIVTRAAAIVDLADNDGCEAQASSGASNQN